MAKPIIGIGTSNAGLGGYIPQVNRTGFTELRERKLFYSQREIGLFIQKTFLGGYGDLPKGTVVAEDVNTGFLVPYIPDTIDVEKDFGRIELVTGCNASNTFQIWAEDRGKIKIGNIIVLVDSDTTAEEATVTGLAAFDDKRWTVTLSGNTTGNFEVGAKKANCYLKAGASGKRSTAKYILDQDTFTGDADNPNGSLSSVFVSNGVIYKDYCFGLDATALSALGGTVDGLFAIFK